MKANNVVMLLGRTTNAPEIRYGGADNKAIAKWTMAIDGVGENAKADFPNCVAFGKTAEFIEKYVGKGQKILVMGKLSTSSYEKEGKKYYKTEVLVENVEFAESKKVSQTQSNDFMSIPDDMEDLPFN